MSFDTTSPWGTWRARGLAACCLALVAALPRTGFCRRLAFLIRKPVKAGRQGLYDREIWGLRLRLSARGNLTEQRWLTMEQFQDWPEREALRAALQPGGVFLDVGANAGFYTFWAVAQRLPGLRVIAIEPNPAMVERLRFNIAANDATGAVRVYACAATAVAGEVTIAENTGNLGQTGLTDGVGQRVLGRPLLDLLTEAGVERVDVLKIDIEGHEVPVLEAFFRTAPESLWPRLIIGETVGTNGIGFHQLLLSHGYALAGTTKMNGIFRR